MAFVTDSTKAGYLGPTTVTQPEGVAFEDWLHDLFAGITGLPNNMVRPSWQWVPAPRPDPNTDWLAFGVNAKESDFTPAITHFDEGDGYDLVQDHEHVDLICTFYGPNVELYANYLRRGFYLDQNRASCRAAGVGLIEVGSIRLVPEVFNERWWSRADVMVALRREVRLIYPVLNLVRAQGTFYVQDPWTGETMEKSWDTDDAVTHWDIDDIKETLWDDGKTLWDIPL